VIVRDTAGTARQTARRFPRLAERDDRLWVLLATPTLRDHPEEDPRNDLPGGALGFIGRGSPCVQEDCGLVDVFEVA
jgi:hypothetical protein